MTGREAYKALKNGDAISCLSWADKTARWYTNSAGCKLYYEREGQEPTPENWIMAMEELLSEDEWEVYDSGGDRPIDDEPIEGISRVYLYELMGTHHNLLNQLESFKDLVFSRDVTLSDLELEQSYIKRCVKEIDRVIYIIKGII